VAEFSHIDRALIALGAVILGFALQLNSGAYDPRAIAVLALTLPCVAAGVLRIGSRFFGAGREWFVPGVLTLGLAGCLVALATTPPGFFFFAHPRPIEHPQLIAGLAAATVLIALITVDPRRRRHLWFPLLLVVFAHIGMWLIRASPRPGIDVMTVQRAAIKALMHGTSPYSISFPNIYRTTDLYPPGMADERTVWFGLPYPPLSLLMAVPGERLFGDLRYAELAALIVGAGAIGLVARGVVAPLAAALVLFTPRSLFVLEQAWTESFAICWLGLVVLAATRRSGHLPIALGLLFAVKQHMVLALPLAAWLSDPSGAPHDARRLVLRAVAIAAAVTLPFFLWDPSGFWRSVVTLQFYERFRVDSLSMLVYFSREGWPISAVTQTLAPLLALSVGLALALLRAPRTPSGFAAGLGFAFLLLFAFSKKAFCNYYFLTIALLAAGVAAGSDEHEVRGGRVDGESAA
jgi:hypothetical protein